MLTINNLNVYVDNKHILKDLNLEINRGEMALIMGPNGSGKSTLCQAIMGNPFYRVTGKIIFEGTDITNIPTHERAKKGIFLGFQEPMALEGLSVFTFLKTSYFESKGIEENTKTLHEFYDRVLDKLKILGLDEDFLDKEINVQMSTGEKKKSELLQMLVLEPKLIIFDEIDTGLDVDSIKLLGRVLNTMNDGSRSFLIITHYARFVDYTRVDKTFVLLDGKILLKGDKSLAQKIEREGYQWITKENR